jgi:hypothetical protein
MAFKVCCLTRSELDLYVSKNQLPDCANCNPNASGSSSGSGTHAHVKVEKAFGLVGKDDGSGEAMWVGSGCRMLYQHKPRVWKAKDSGGAGGTRVMQFVEIRGRRPAFVSA